MQLVLLSGGSGKRLWPLSNDARSKQFLPLLEREDGKMESMVQRVVRQAQEANLTSNITLATNVGQLEIITNQLGDSVSVVTEPERRDTFPAIALAASYLRLEKRCPENEVVVIMPSDPYTEIEYFRAIGKMVECVEHNVAELVLMGITPSYPSEKYGYIVPIRNGATNDSMAVSHFIEKPNVNMAKELISEGALWNGGVFAFRLGYMMDIVCKYINQQGFEEIRSMYHKFPKISFDYEVVEKASSVAVVPFCGVWKDLGTWNSLTEELQKNVIGNAIIGNNCKNSHIINELPTPIYADGLSDMIVSASPDGILVCAKSNSEEIKKAVDKLSSRPMYEERSWGNFRILDDSIFSDGCHSTTKSISLRKGKSIGIQPYNNMTEVLTVIDGEGIVSLDGIERRIKAGDSVVSHAGRYQSILAKTPMTLISVICDSTPD